MLKFESENNDFMYVLNRYNKGYDEAVNLYKRPFSSPGYHTTLTGGDVHPTRDSLTYAVALFDSNKPEYIKRGTEIALKVISLQDQDPDSPTYGIWSWFYEEPLSMMSPPDWNWADFCGKELLQIAKDHASLLSNADYEAVKTAVYHACKSIMRRDVSVSYTNISIMGTYVTFVAGETLGFDDVLEYADARLRKIHKFNMENNNFVEYNSPTYTLIAAEDLGQFYNDAKNAGARALIADLQRIAWKTVYNHFHMPTLQWVGPNARRYDNFLKPETQASLQFACGLQFMEESELKEYLPVSAYRKNLKCPEEFVSKFQQGAEGAEIGEIIASERYSKNTENGYENISFSYMNRYFALGSFYKSDLWNQRRPLAAYFGTREKPVCLRLRMLHDFYDYSSGFITTAQYKGSLTSVVGFATNGGDTHCNLDMVKNATIKAADFRLRFELTGATDCISADLAGKTFQFEAGEIKARIEIPSVAFGDFDIRYEINKGEGAINLDIVLYSGEERQICFSELKEAYCAFYLRINAPQYETKGELTVEKDQKIVTAKIGAETDLSISSALCPDTFAALYGAARGTINGKNISDVYE